MCPIFLAVCRVGACSICDAQWELPPEGGKPEICPSCGTSEWEWGPESRDSRFIRQKITRARRVVNKGARSRKRQEQGKRQYQQFKPKPVEPEAQEEEN
jgi:hypothetical protein